MRVVNHNKLDQLAEYIESYAVSHNGDMPVLSQMIEYLGCSKGTVYNYLIRLNEEGRIEYNGKRTLDLKKRKKSTMKYRSVRVPIYGSVICGSPEEEEQYTEGYLAIPEEWIDGECFLLRARGDSMIDIGVNEDDLVLVKRTLSAEDGQVVVALTENGNTLKRLRYENGIPVLYAENSKYTAVRRVIRPKQLAIQGIALKIIKDVR